MAKYVHYILVTYFITGSLCATNYYNNFLWWQMVTSCITVTILKCVSILNHYDVLLKLKQYFMSIILQLKKKKDWQNPRKHMKQSNTWDVVEGFHTRLAKIQWAKMQSKWKWKWNWPLLLPYFLKRTGDVSSLEKGLLLLVDLGCIFLLLPKSLHCDLQVSEFPTDE